MKPAEIQKLVAIAKKHYLLADDREDMNAKNSDSQDFTDCAVWNISAALVEAYALGRASKE